MNDEMVKRLRSFLVDEPPYGKGLRMSIDHNDVAEAADAIERLTRERDNAVQELGVWARKAGVAETRIAGLESELADQRMCVNCGKYAPKSHDRSQPLPECTDSEGYAACTFDMTPSEAWQHWKQIAHDQRARIAKLRDALHRISLGSQDSGTRKEDLGRDARKALEDI